MKLDVNTGACISNDSTFKPSIACLPDGSTHADVCRDTSNYQIPDTSIPENELKVGIGKSPLARLVNDRLTLDRVQLRDDIMTLTTTYEQTSTKWAGSAYALLRGVVARTESFPRW